MSISKYIFGGSKVHLVSGKEYTISGELDLQKSGLSLLIGKNGSGKTLTLASISHNEGVPAFKKIESVNSIIKSNGLSINDVAIVRQAPIENFTSNTGTSEFRSVFWNSTYSIEEFENLLIKLFNNGLDIKIASSDVNKMSTGERQLLSICISLLSGANLLLMDEPFSHLSRNYTTKILKLIKENTSDRYFLITTHLNSNEVDILENEINLKHNIVRNNDVFNINQAREKKRIIEIKVDKELTSDLFIDFKSYEQEARWSENFDNIPQNSIRCITGLGEQLFENNISYLIKSKSGSVLTQSSNFNICRGINIIYGDNGSGKTLSLRFLNSQIVKKGYLPKSIWLETNEISLNKAYLMKVGLPNKCTLKTLQTQGLSYLLNAEIDQTTVFQSVGKELKQYMTDEEFASSIDWLGRFEIDVEDDISDLSYGQQKMVSLAKIPSKMSLVLLDEPYANLSELYAKELSKYILNKIDSQSWDTIVLASNKPQLTIPFLGLHLFDFTI